MNKSTSDQLLDMLKTIDETEAFLRKRCAGGQAGQSMGLFEDLASLLELMDSRYRKSGYLPRDHVPTFGATPDILSAVRFLDAVNAWSRKVRDRVKRRQVRQELARGGILEAAAGEGKPFAREAAEIAQLVRGPVGSPEERAEMDRGVSVSFSSQARALNVEPPVFPPEPKEAPAPQEAPPEKPAGFNLDDPASEGARLFAGMRARTGRSAAMPRTEENPVEAQTRPMGAKPMEAEARPMGAKPMEAEARPMGAKPMEAEARPMGAKPMEAEARPMGAKPMEAEARPMGAKPMEPDRPAAMETSTVPAGGRGVAIDREFLRVINEIGAMAPEELEKKLVGAFPQLENRYKIVICDQARRYGYWGRLEPDRNEFELLRRRAEELCSHRDEYAWLYGKLGDYRSRKTLLALLDNWYSFNFKDLSNMREKQFGFYLDADLLRCSDSEVFVDLGAGIGDVTKAYAEFAGHWKRIYCYEPNPGNFSALRATVRTLGLVEARQKAVSDRAGQGSLVTGQDPLLSHLGDGGQGVETVVLDDDIQEPVSIIKMCLEGGEQAAIRGCSNHIHRDHPRLVLRADHGDSDLWQLPRMIERLDKKYRFFLRHYGGNLLPMDYVLYAI